LLTSLLNYLLQETVSKARRLVVKGQWNEICDHSVELPNDYRSPEELLDSKTLFRFDC